jgi:hypothetical protein
MTPPDEPVVYTRVMAWLGPATHDFLGIKVLRRVRAQPAIAWQLMTVDPSAEHQPGVIQ